MKDIYDDVDRCYECTGLGDDYYYDENGDIVSYCDECYYSEYDPEED